MLDRWQKRELERALAQELNYANARVRTASMRLRDATSLTSRQLAFMASDSQLLLVQAKQEFNAASEAYVAAMERWKHFVIHGHLPETKSAAASSAPPGDG